MKRLNSFKPKQTEHDKLLYKICVYAFLLIALLILFEKIIGHLPSIGMSISNCVQALLRLTSPFIMGFAIAYIMNPFIQFFERHLCKISNFFSAHKKITRIFCILLNYIIVIGGTAWIVVYLLPEIRNSVTSFASNISVYSATMNIRIQNIFDQIPYIDSSDVNSVLNRILEPIQDASKNAPQLLEALAANVYSFGRVTLNFVMAIFIAFYMLYDKERFCASAKKIIYTFSSEKKATRIVYNANRVHHIFNDFIIGKALDSLIIGILAFIGMTIIKAPFPLILSLIIGVTNIIPYFGPFIGAIPSILITLLIDPPIAIAVAIFILILQQFDGNFLGPKILGNSVDLSPLWIILAVMVGGAAIGPLGMFIGVPVFATIKVFGGEYIDRLYQKKYSVTPKELQTEAELSEPSE